MSTPSYPDDCPSPDFNPAPKMDADKQRLDFLNEHPESLPYLEDGLWRIPYLMDGAGGFGGGVGEMTHRTLRGVIDAAMTSSQNTKVTDAEPSTPASARAHGPRSV